MRDFTATALALAAGLAFASPASAQHFPTPGNMNERDHVTGYLCVTAGCDVLRHPTANCICQKENPAEQNLARLKLTCSARENGQWVACPVPQRYGN